MICSFYQLYLLLLNGLKYSSGYMYVAFGLFTQEPGRPDEILILSTLTEAISSRIIRIVEMKWA